MLAKGTRIAGYELACQVDRASMSEVWVAYGRPPHDTDRLFFLRCFRPAISGNPDFRSHLIEGARAASPLAHANVARLLDFGEAEEMLYLATEYVDGITLAAAIRELSRRSGHGATVPLGIALRIMLGVCAGLEAAHSYVAHKGNARVLAHGQLSPESIFLGTNGEVKVAHIGVDVDDRKGSYTSDTAPERAAGGPATPQADIFSAGAILYRMLVGRGAFDDAEGAQRRAGAAPTAPPSTSPYVVRILERALATNPASRYPTVGEMRDAIEATIAEQGYTEGIGAWVASHLDDDARQRHAELARTRPTAEAPDAGFMDIGALVARAKDAPPRPDPPVASAPHATRPKANAPPSLGVPKAASKSTPSDPAAKKAIRLAALAVGVVLCVTAVFLVSPLIVRDRVIANARAAGIEMTIDSVGVGFSGATLRNVTARAARLPQVDVRIGEIAQTGWSKRQLLVRGASVTMKGPLTERARDFERFYAENAIRLDTVSHVSVVAAEIAHADPFGAGSSLNLGGVGIEMDVRGPGQRDVRANVARIDAKTKVATLGPFAASVEVTNKSARVHFVFDPPVPDGPSALIAWTPGATPRVTVHIARSPITRLGVRPAELGIPADAKTDVEVEIESGPSATGRVTGTARVNLYGARIRGMNSPVDIRMDGGFDGAPGKPLQLTRATTALGPFVANVTGTLTPKDFGFRLDAAFRTQSISCDRLARAEAKSWGPLAEAIADVARGSGAVRVTGSAQAAGTVKYDTDAPDEGSLSFSTKDSCGLSIFGM